MPRPNGGLVRLDAEIVARLQSVLVSALVHVDAALVALDEARKTADAEINAAGPK
jgi:hypothetical protein